MASAITVVVFDMEGVLTHYDRNARTAHLARLAGARGVFVALAAPRPPLRAEKAAGNERHAEEKREDDQAGCVDAHGAIVLRPRPTTTAAAGSP